MTRNEYNNLIELGKTAPNAEGIQALKTLAEKLGSKYKADLLIPDPNLKTAAMYNGQTYPQCRVGSHLSITGAVSFPYVISGKYKVLGVYPQPTFENEELPMPEKTKAEIEQMAELARKQAATIENDGPIDEDVEDGPKDLLSVIETVERIDPTPTTAKRGRPSKEKN